MTKNLYNPGRKVLVVEDSRPDRLRFRSILEMMGVDFSFAWNAKAQEIPSVDRVFELIKKKASPSVLLLDLAWTVQDDTLIQGLLFHNMEDIEKEKKKIEKESYQNNRKLWISGFRLLEKMKNEKENDGIIKNIRIIVTTQYIPAVAHGLRQYLWVTFPFIIDIVHKWRGEKRLRSLI